MTDEHMHLRSYAESGDQADFAAVVHRLLPMVYRAALRRVQGDAHRAQDVTQLVFAALARNARSLAHHPDLAGWIFTTTRFLAAKTLRSERRRSARERAAAMSEFSEPSDAAPTDTSLPVLLDEIVADLKQVDQQVILLRFHRGLRLTEIGERLGLTENAVQKRLERALDQLKEKLSRRGVTSTAAALALAFDQQAAVAVPAGLSALSTQAAVTWGATGSMGILGFMSASKLQICAVIALAGAGSVGLVWQHHETERLRGALRQQSAIVGTKAAELERQVANQTKRADAAEADLAKLLAAVRANQSLPTDPSHAAIATGPTPDLPTETIARASQLKKDGKLQEAVELCVKAYRERRPLKSGDAGQNMIVGYLAGLGRTFAPAIDSLRTLRDTAVREFEASPASNELGTEAAWLNKSVADSRTTVALFDRLPADSPLRQTFSLLAQDAFVEARRYQDALVGESYGTMIGDLERGIQTVARATNSNRENVEDLRQTVVQKAALHIEILTGAGLQQEARQLTDQLLTFDRSNRTQTLIQQHIERAGPAPLR